MTGGGSREWLTLAEAAEELGLAHASLLDAVRRKALRVEKVNPRLSLVHVSEVERYRRDSLVLQRELGWVERLKAPQALLAVGPIRGELVAAVIAQQRYHRQEVETRQRQQGAQQQAHLGDAQAQRRRGREQGCPVRGRQG